MRTVLILMTLAALSGCTDKQEKPQSTLTRRERDSIIGQSPLPGARGVRRALEAADSAAARQRRAAQIQ